MKKIIGIMLLVGLMAFGMSLIGGANIVSSIWIGFAVFCLCVGVSVGTVWFIFKDFRIY